MVAVCAIDKSGNITCGSSGVLTTATGYTQTQIDNIIDAGSGISDTSDITVGTR